MIRLYQQQQHIPGTEVYIDGNSPVIASNSFKITLITDGSPDYYKTLPVQSIFGVADEIPQIKMGTGLANAPVTKLTDMIHSFSQNKYVKLFAQQHKEYKPVIATDGWTQLFPKDGQRLGVSFKFKSYPISNFLNTSAYSDIIQFLILLTTPQEYNITDEATLMQDAYEGSKSVGKSLGERIKALNSVNFEDINFKSVAMQIENGTGSNNTAANTASEREAKIAYEINEILRILENIGKLNGNETGGTPYCTFEFGNIIAPGKPWLIKSWSFKPSLQTHYHYKNEADPNNPLTGKIEPLYVDFNINLETAWIVTAEDLKEILK